LGTPIEKLMMSRPSRLEALGLLGDAMMALGLARPTRLASCGIGIPRVVRERRRISAASVRGKRALQTRKFSIAI
jgi:hypothetical protein